MNTTFGNLLNQGIEPVNYIHSGSVFEIQQIDVMSVEMFCKNNYLLSFSAWDSLLASTRLLMSEVHLMDDDSIVITLVLS